MKSDKTRRYHAPFSHFHRSTHAITLEEYTPWERTHPRSVHTLETYTPWKRTHPGSVPRGERAHSRGVFAPGICTLPKVLRLILLRHQYPLLVPSIHFSEHNARSMHCFSQSLPICLLCIILVSLLLRHMRSEGDSPYTSKSYPRARR